jgi:hypothetical protein
MSAGVYIPRLLDYSEGRDRRCAVGLGSILNVLSGFMSKMRRRRKFSGKLDNTFGAGSGAF